MDDLTAILLIRHLEAALAKQEDDIQQILGKALGYPWFKDDQKNFPGATEENGVCVGEHTAETLAMEAAKELARLKAGRFTKEEIHAICHNLHGTVSACEFADACAAEQRKLYGRAPDADAVAALLASVALKE